MKAKDKVLKIHPDATVRINNGYTIIRVINEDSTLCLSNKQIHESWAWAEAYRTLTTPTNH